MGETNSYYEISVNVGGRWEIHARYPVSGASAAVEEAKQLEKTAKFAVKVIRENYDSETGLYNQSVIYKSAHVARTPTDTFAAKAQSYRSNTNRRARVRAEAEGAYGLDDEINFEKDARPRFGLRAFNIDLPKRVTVAGLVGRVSIIILVGLAVAALVTGLFPLFAPKLAARNLAVVGGGQTSVLFVVFIATFFVSFATIAAVLLSGLEIIGPPRRVRRVQAQPKRTRRVRQVRRRLSGSPEALLQSLKDGMEPPPGDGAPELKPEVEEESAAEAPQEGEENILEAEADAESADALPLSPAAEQQKAKMMSFLEGASGHLKGAGEIDAFARFGVHLFLAGAVDSLSTTQGLEDADARGILHQAVQVLGTPGDMAGKFAENTASYLMQPKYIEMYEIGRRAMMAFLEGDPEGGNQLSGALEIWRNPVQKEGATGPLAVVFTDIVGSTNMAVTLGDEAAQYVVRTHNRIVRSALTNFAGREIKHTGDGIMASFASVSNAVEAAIEIQRRVMANNVAEGDIPLHLRVGINAGEPVVEDDDLFGVTVQLAARLCAAAETGQIIVSEVVKSLCSGKSIQFASRGQREMKGFNEPLSLYEAVWRKGDSGS